MKNFYFLGAAITVMVIAGCSTPVSLDQKLVTTSREALEDADTVELPSGFNVDNFRSLKMGVVVEDLPAAEGVKAKPLPEFVKRKVEGDLIKLKRFTIIPMKDEGGKMVFQDLADIDPNIQLKEQVKPNEIDLILTLQAQRTKQSINQGDGKYTIFYTVDGQAACRDLKKGEGVFSETIKGQSKETQCYSPTGQFERGFDDRSVDAVNNSLVRAAKRALTVMFSKLGNMYPIGGCIIKCDRYGEMLTLDKGTDDGVGAKNQQFTIVVDDDGQNVPVCYAEAQAGKKESVLKPYRWNSDNRAAKDLRDEFESNPRDFIKKYKVYAVGHGLAMPAEWDVDGEKAEVNAIIER